VKHSPSRIRAVVLASAVAVVLLLALAVHQRFAQMDSRFFDFADSGISPFSAYLWWPGIKGLGLYLTGDLAGSARAYREHLRKHSSPDEFDDPAEAALVHGDPAEARRLARERLAKKPREVAALLTLGQASLAEGAYREALAEFRSVLDVERDQFDALLLSSVSHARLGAYGDAIDSLNRALRHNRIEARLWSFLAALEMTGELSSRPLDQRPLCLLAHFHRYLRIFDSAQGRSAIAYARQAIQAGDRPADAYLTLGIVLWKQGKREDSLKAFVSGVEVGPSNPEVLRSAAVAYAELGDLAAAYRLIRAAAEAAPDDPLYADTLNYMLVERLGDYRQALGLAQAALRKAPEDPDALARVGWLLDATGDVDGSVEQYQRAVALAPNRASLRADLGEALKNAGRYEESIEELKRAIAIDDTQPRAHAVLGFVYFRTQKYSEALKEYERALDLGEGDPSVLGALCTLYVIGRQFERAASCFRQLVALEPGNVAARVQLGHVERTLSMGRERR
jgi:tetratricopeptide (TPR) repeat protein